MKGITTIQLFDKDKKLIKETTDENFITNAFKHVVETISETITYPPSSRVATDCFLGLNPSDFFSGGLLLLSETLNEDPDMTQIHRGEVVGHASGAYSGTLSTKGSRNDNESGDIVNGYRWVWDFATDKANGIINCVCLVPYYCGDAILGQTYTGYVSANQWYTITMSDFSPSSGYYTTIVSSRFVGKKGKKVYHQTAFSGTIGVVRYDDSHLSSVPYSGRVSSDGIVHMTTPLDSGDFLRFLYAQDQFYGLFYDSSAAKWYLRTYLEDDFMTVLSSVELDTSVVSPTTGHIEKWSILKNKLYCLSSSNDSFLVYNITDGSYVGSVSLPLNIASGADSYGIGHVTDDMISIQYERDTGSYDNNYLFLYNGDSFVGPLITVYSDDYYNTYDVHGFNETGEVLISYRGGGVFALLINPFILSTINNLSTPVEKDDTQTMKVTYELTW